MNSSRTFRGHLQAPVDWPKRRQPNSKTDKPRRRKRGEAQREVVRFIIQYKMEHNGFSPTYAEIAEYMGYKHRVCARNIVSGIVEQNLPKRPYLVDAGEYGLVSLEFDDKKRILVREGQFSMRIPA